MHIFNGRDCPYRLQVNYSRALANDLNRKKSGYINKVCFVEWGTFSFIRLLIEFFFLSFFFY